MGLSSGSEGHANRKFPQINSSEAEMKNRKRRNRKRQTPVWSTWMKIKIHFNVFIGRRSGFVSNGNGLSGMFLTTPTWCLQEQSGDASPCSASPSVQARRQRQVFSARMYNLTLLCLLGTPSDNQGLGISRKAPFIFGNRGFNSGLPPCVQLNWDH